MIVVRQLIRKLRRSPTHRHDSGPVLHSDIDRTQHIVKTIGRGFDQENTGFGGYDMRPLHIQSDFESPEMVQTRPLSRSIDLAKAPVG